jgi:hypothetical protein
VPAATGSARTTLGPIVMISLMVGIQDNSIDSDNEPVDINVDYHDSDDDIPLLQLYNEGGIVLYSAEDLSDEVDVMDLDASLEIVSEVVVTTLDDEVAIPEDEIVAGPSRVSNKRKVENRVFVVPNKTPRTK